MWNFFKINVFLNLVCKSIIKSNFPKFLAEILLLAKNKYHHLNPKYFNPKSIVSKLILYSFAYPKMIFMSP